MHIKGSHLCGPFFYVCKYDMRFGLYTLVDITETGARRGEDPKLMRQQQNFLTVLQTIGLRVNPTYVRPPKIINEIPKNLGLECDSEKKQKIWDFVFDIDYEDALTIETLVKDFDLIPIITDLDETAKFNNAVFISQNGNKNIVFFRIDDK